VEAHIARGDDPAAVGPPLEVELSDKIKAE